MAGDSVSDTQPELRSRSDRLFAYLRHNRSRMVVDVTVLVAWMLATSIAFNLFALPNWLWYVVLFIGVIVYSRVTPTWERPYQSPD